MIPCQDVARAMIFLYNEDNNLFSGKGLPNDGFGRQYFVIAVSILRVTGATKTIWQKTGSLHNMFAH
jgi:hypothetical protein